MSLPECSSCSYAAAVLITEKCAECGCMICDNCHRGRFCPDCNDERRLAVDEYMKELESPHYDPWDYDDT